MIDNIFGKGIEPEQRLADQIQNLSGVKHLNRLEPLKPRPGSPTTLVLTTSADLPFDAARGWFTLDLPPGVVVDAPSGNFELRPSGSEWDTLTWRYVQRWQGTLPAQPAGVMVRYRLAAHVASGAAPGRWVYADNQAERAEEST